MESLQQRLDRTLLKPQGNASRILSALFIFLMGAGGIYLYFAIEYILCVDNNCVDLVVTKTWLRLPIFFVLYGICCFVVGIFVWRSKDLKIIFAWAISLLAGCSFYLLSKIFFAIAIEIGTSA